MRRFVAVLVLVLLAPGTAQAAFGPLGNQRRLSHMGPDGNTPYAAYSPKVAFNSAADEYLVVWAGDDNTPPLVDQEYEIYAQRVSRTGTPVGSRIRVSAQGPDGDPHWGAASPSVAYNPSANEYLVVWEGTTATTDPLGEKVEIWSRRLSAKGERLGGSDDVQLSNTGDEDDADFDALNPSIAANPESGEYLVVWESDDLGVNDEFEITGQRVTAAGAETGGNDFRISEQGANGNADSDAIGPSVAYDPVTNEFLVAWLGEIGTTDVFEIWAQRLDAEGAEVGGSDFQISGAEGVTIGTEAPDVAANPVTGGYLVVWASNQRFGSLTQFEIFGQRLTATGAETGVNDFKISDMDTSGSTFTPRNAIAPRVAASPATGEFVVVWAGDDEKTKSISAHEFEIFGQRLTAMGKATGADDFRISRMGPDGSSLAQVVTPAIAPRSKGNQFLVPWAGNDLLPGQLDGEIEIHARRLASQFGSKAQVGLALAAKRTPASGPLRVRITNRNEFAVSGKLVGRGLRAGFVRVAAHGKKVLKLRLTAAGRRALARNGMLRLRLVARVTDPAGHVRAVRKSVTVRLAR